MDKLSYIHTIICLSTTQRTNEYMQRHEWISAKLYQLKKGHKGDHVLYDTVQRRAKYGYNASTWTVEEEDWDLRSACETLSNPKRQEE